MANTLDNSTLSSILSELQKLNTNLSTGNLLGDKNKLFRNQDKQTGWDAFNKRQRELRDSDKEKLERWKVLAKNGATEAIRKNAKEWERKKRADYVKHSMGAAATPEAILTTTKNITSMIFTVLETNIKKQTIRLQTASELQTRAIQTYGKALNNVIGVQVSNVTGNVLDTAYQSLNAVIEGGRSFYMKNLADAITYRKQENEIYKANSERNMALIEGAGSSLAAFGGTVSLVGNALNIMASAGRRYAMLTAARTQLEIQQNEEIKKNQDEWLQQIEGVVKQFSDMSKLVTKSFLEAGNSAYAYSRTLGLSGGGLRQYHDALIESVNVAMSELAMDFNDYMKMQNAYNEATGGRAGIVGTGEARLMGGLSYRLGIGAEQVASITGSMNVFNTSIADGSEMIYKMANTASKMGLSATKFAKDLEKNLKLAEKYQFRGGVKGMMEMAVWAQRTRFNVDSMTSLLEKGLSGNIEDMLQTSARLNVLGGNAALYSDPMGMLFDAMDPMAMAQRVNNMIQGFGRFNAATGTTDFNRVEMMRMQQIAQTLGMSREDLMNQARQANKEKAITGRYGGKFGNGQLLSGLTQYATWSTDKNDWIVKVNAPGSEKGFEEKTLSELDPNDKEILQNIFPEDKQDTLIMYVKNISDYFSSGEMQKYADKYGIATTMGASNRKGLVERTTEMALEKIRTTNRDKEENSDMVVRFAKSALDAQRRMNEFIRGGGAKSTVEAYLAWSEAKNDELLKETSIFFKNNGNIEQKLLEIKLAILNIQSLTENGKFKNNLTKEQIALYNQVHQKEIEDIVYNRLYTTKGQKLTNKDELNSIYKDFMEGSLTMKNFKDNTIYRRQSGSFNAMPINIEDAIITPRGTVYTHPDDMIAAFKPNGDIMKGLNGNGTTKLEVSGTLRLETNGQSIDLMELVRNNPESLRRLTEEVLITADKNYYGGRSKHAPGRYTVG